MIGAHISLGNKKQVIEDNGIVSTIINYHWNRVIDDGGQFPNGNTTEDYFNLSSAVVGLVNVYRANTSTTLYAGYDPKYFGFKPDTGTGTTLGMACQKLYSIQGASSDVVQTTAANQPLLLNWTSSEGNYGFLPGVAGNYFSTPSAPANQITGDIDIRARINPSLDWTPSADRGIVAKFSTNQQAYSLRLTTGGTLRFNLSQNGTTNSNVTSAAVPFTNQTGWVRVTWTQSDGRVKFFTGGTGETPVWVQLGVDSIIAIASIFASSSPLEVGSFFLGASDPMLGKVLYAEVRNGINGVVAASFDPNDYNVTTSQTTWVSSLTGETWTANSGVATSGYKTSVVYRTILQFDQTNDVLKSGAFTLNQPSTAFMSIRQLSWNSTRTLMDGNALSSMRIYQNVGSPTLQMTSDAVNVVANANATVRLWKMLTCHFNGASSKFQVNNANDATGNAGAGNGGGVTIGAAGDNSLPSNLGFQSLVISKAATETNAQRTAMWTLIHGWGGDFA
jgi:hypothetical protein